MDKAAGFDRPLRPLRAAFAALEEAHVGWAVMRDDPLRDPGPDIDLLVLPGDMDRFAGVVARVGFGHVPAWGYGLHRFFFAYEAAADAWRKLDVVTGLAFRDGTVLPEELTAKLIARRSQVKGGVPRLAASDEFWALLLHCLLDRASVADRHADRLATLAATAGLEGPLHLALSANPVLARTLVECARTGNWRRALEMRAEVRGAMLAGAGSIMRPVRAAAQGRLAWGLRRVHRMVDGSSISVALVGPDSGAKSRLVRSLAAQFLFPTRYLRIGRARDRVRSGQLLREARAHLRDALARQRRRLVIYDIPDPAMLPEHWPPEASSRTPQQLTRWVRPPLDLIVMLDNHPEGERSATELAPFEVVDPSRDPDSLRREVTALIWQRYVQRAAGGP